MKAQIKDLHDNEITLVLEREFNAPRERVFDAWSDQENLRQWMGPRDTYAPEVTIDVCIGGEFRIPMTKRETGEVVAIAVGDYIEINRPDRLSFTWSWLQEDGKPGQQMIVTLDFVDLNGRTAMTLTHTNFIDEEVKSQHNSGWNDCFDSLETFLAT
jgi:uncharacterized protein YndB with AHSA1/START domain